MWVSSPAVLLFFCDDQWEIAGVVGNLFQTMIQFLIRHAAVFRHNDIPSGLCQQILYFLHFASGFHQHVAARLVRYGVQTVNRRDNMQRLRPLDKGCLQCSCGRTEGRDPAHKFDRISVCLHQMLNIGKCWIDRRIAQRQKNNIFTLIKDLLDPGGTFPVVFFLLFFCYFFFNLAWLLEPFLFLS